MTSAILIPARYASSRYPGKPLVGLTGATGQTKPLIQRSWEAAKQVPGVARVVIATDDSRIADAATAFGAEVTMTPVECANGTERCAAALEALGEDVDVVVNFQGDALLTPPHFIGDLLAAMDLDQRLTVATPAIRADGETHRRLADDQSAGRVGGTTVVSDASGDALYFSKSVIPHVAPARIGEPGLPVRLHVGVYAYRRDVLLRYPAHPASALELLEGLEQLRFLDMRVPIRVVDVDPHGADIWELNNPSDVAPIERALAERGMI
jgi:3-deoxy-manno-octulosonate cytidylyltransferase (CMP-KDO synthetase)